MTNTICRFLATPSPVFELLAEAGQEPLSVQQFAIVRLAQCVQVSFGFEYQETTVCNKGLSLDQAIHADFSSCYFNSVCIAQ